MTAFRPNAADIDGAAEFLDDLGRHRATSDEVKRAAIALAKAYPHVKADDDFLRMLAADIWSLNPTRDELVKLVTTYRRENEFLTCHAVFVALKRISILRHNAEAVARMHTGQRK